MTLSVAVVCEDRADRVTITTLAELVILDVARRYDPPWVDADNLRDHIAWRGFRASDQFLKWTELNLIADDLKLVIRFKDEPPLHPYAQNALRAIRVLARAPDRVDAIVLVADSDCDLDRMRGLEQARRYAREALPIAVGLAHTKRECWHIIGFEPQDEDEHAALEKLRQELGFDPRLRSEDLTAKHDAENDKRSAKRVLAELTRGDRDRENQCLAALPLTDPELGRVGDRNGLATFVRELRTHLIPLLFPSPVRPSS